MKTTNVAEATGPALDWLVAKCEVLPVALHNTGAIFLIDTPWADKSRVIWLAEYSPSKHWAQGGPIIEREIITITAGDNGKEWHATVGEAHSTDCPNAIGCSPLIAAMRCYVASKLGDEVEVPDELIKENQP